MPISLSAAELTLLTELAGPIDQRLRPEFMQTVATELETRRAAGGIGEGTIYGIARQAQRKFWQPPQFGEGRR